VAFITEVNPIDFLPLCIKIVKRFLFFVVTERAVQSIDSPLITAIGAEEIPLSRFLFQ